MVISTPMVLLAQAIPSSGGFPRDFLLVLLSRRKGFKGFGFGAKPGLGAQGVAVDLF